MFNCGSLHVFAHLVFNSPRKQHRLNIGFTLSPVQATTQSKSGQMPAKFQKFEQIKKKNVIVTVFCKNSNMNFFNY